MFGWKGGLSGLELRLCLGALSLLGLSVQGSGQKGAPSETKGLKQQAKASLEPSTPLLQAISLEVESLKRSVAYQVGMGIRPSSGKPGLFKHGIHLGKGLIAAPYSDGMKPGDCGFAYFKEGKYRVIHIGSDKPFVSFFRLLDPLGLDRLPVPKLRRRLKKGEKSGNLVVLLGPMGEARLSFLPHLPRFRSSRRLQRTGSQMRGRPPRRRLRSAFSFFGFILPGESVVNGSVVLNPKGEFLGLAVQGPQRIRSHPLRGKPQGGKPQKSSPKRLRPPHIPQRNSSERSLGKLSFVLSHRLLMGRAERWSKKTRHLLPNRILLGISLDWWGARKKKGEGVVVSDLFPGAPASQAGIRVGDRLLRFGEKTIHGRKDLMEAIARHKVGDLVPLLVLRAGKQIPLKIHLN